MDNERVIAVFLLPFVLWAKESLASYLERRRARKEAERGDHYSSVVVSAPLRLGRDSGGNQDCSGRGGPRQS